jgi:deoxyribonuclease V
LVSTEDTQNIAVKCGAVDVHYPDTGGARAALVVYRDEVFAELDAEYVAILEQVAAYRPGNFYERELPAIRAVLTGAGQLDLLVVDGYVDLDPAGRPGLGAHVYAEWNRPVIGVAKTFFHTATHAIPVRRGASERPLYVTAAGLPLDRAVALVAGMHGGARIPTALAAVDALARTGRTTITVAPPPD